MAAGVARLRWYGVGRTKAGLTQSKCGGFVLFMARSDINEENPISHSCEIEKGVVV